MSNISPAHRLGIAFKDTKDKFLDVYKQWVTRPGADEFLKWLESTNFFAAPASARFHLSRSGVLVEHSIHVYHRLRDLYVMERQTKENGVFLDLSEKEGETIAICGLLHDICKANFYGVQVRNRKNKQSIQVPLAENGRDVPP